MDTNKSGIQIHDRDRNVLHTQRLFQKDLRRKSVENKVSFFWVL